MSSRAKGSPTPIAEVLRYLAIALAVFIAVFPLFWLVIASFKSQADLVQIPPVLVFTPTLENYAAVMSEGFGKYFANSVVITIGSVLAAIGLGVPAAYALSRFGFRGKSLTLFAILSVRFVPYIVFAVPLFLIFVRVGLIGTRVGVIMAYILITLPLVIWLMKGFFDDIPTELDEAALVDGATSFQGFTRVILPNAGAGIASVTILCFIFAWNEYLFSLILASRDAQPLTVGLTRFLGGLEFGIRWGLLAAWSVCITLPVVLFSLLVNRYLRRGFTSDLR